MQHSPILMCTKLADSPYMWPS